MLKRILGLLGWLGVVLVLAALAIQFLKPEWHVWRVRLAMAGLACTLLYVLSQWREIARSFSGRNARFGTLAGASVLVVVAILAAINYLGVRHTKRWDLTAAKQFTLADQTKKVLQGLDKPLQIKVFARNEEFNRFRERLEEYQHNAKQIAIEYIDPERTPAKAQQYQIAALNTVVLEYEGRVERVQGDGEQELTNGLVKVVQGRQNKAYFVSGHGERTPEDSDSGGYAAIASLLKSDNFEHSTLVLAQQQAVPADATVLIVAGPKADFLPAEIDSLKKYLAKGGKVFFLLDPPEKQGVELTNLAALLKEWAIEVGNTTVINAPDDFALENGKTFDVADLAPLRGADGTYVLAAKYNSHPIMQGFRVVSAYRLARPIATISAGAEGKFAQTLVETSKNSWGESNVQALAKGQVAREPDKGDKEGPISLAAAVSAPATDVASPAANPADKTNTDAPKPETRIVVFGDSDFASNGIVGFAGNRDMFLNVVNWLGQQENMIAIRPRDPEDRRISLTADQQIVIFWLTVVVIPALILVTGVWTWWRRR